MWRHIILAAVTLGVLLLPFLPALREWLHPSDVTPLSMQRNELNHLIFFADSFRARVKKLHENLDANLHDLHAADAVAVSSSAAELSVVEQKSDAQTACGAGVIRILERASHIVKFMHDAQLPENCSVNADIYAQCDLTVGAGAQLRACLAEGRIILKPRATVHRWIHATQIQVGGEVCITGRITAIEQITFAAPTVFERAGAPSLIFGESRNAVVPAPLPSTVAARQVIRGDGLLDKNAALSCDYVIRGDCRMTEKVSLDGSVKSYGNLHIDSGCCVSGSLVSKKNIVIDGDCAILGPLISFEDIVIGPNCRIGRPDAPTTLICNQLFIAPGCIVHGVITAQKNASFLTVEPTHAI